MSICKSIVIPAFFPNSISSYKKLLDPLELVKKYNMEVVEFYYEGNMKHKIKDKLEILDIKVIYLGAISAKIKNLDLSSLM